MSAFPREVRITRGPELQRVLKEGKRIRTRWLDVRFATSPLGVSGSRVGIIVPKLKHSAVERNRLKRRLRELARVHVLGVCSAGDLVLLARGHTYQADFAALKAEMIGIAETLAPKTKESQATRPPDTT